MASKSKRSANKKAPVIVVRNAQRKIPVDARQLADFAVRAWHACDQGRRRRNWPEEVAVVVVSDRMIAQVHRRFMGIAGPTDVITFQHGEIVISAETARRQARLYRSTLKKELELYVVHGLLHLLGHDDKTVAGSKAMERLQLAILDRLTD